jgi:hypothetical protein
MERMPTGGIRSAGLICEIKTIKWCFNSLNRFTIRNEITFVFKSERNGRSN